MVRNKKEPCVIYSLSLSHLAVLSACDKTLNGFSHQSKKDFVVFLWACPSGSL